MVANERQPVADANNLSFHRGTSQGPALDFLDDDGPHSVDHFPVQYRPTHEISGILPPIIEEESPIIPELIPDANNDIVRVETIIQPSPQIGSDFPDPVQNSGQFEALEIEEIIVPDIISPAENDDINPPAVQHQPTTTTTGLDGQYWKPVENKRIPKPNSRYNFSIFAIAGKEPVVDVYRITQTPKQAIAARGSAAMQALIKEISQLDDKGTFIPVHMHDLNALERRRILPSFTFMEDKYDPTTREFIKTKARTVGGGHRQDPSLYQDEGTWSPTVSTPALFIGAGIAAHEKRVVATVDIPTAYPNAKRDINSDITVHITLDVIETAILVVLHREYSEFVRPDGRMVVKITNALYGLIESAKLWYQEISATLEAAGFIKNAYDLCVFNKTHNGQQISIYLHVDDMLITSCSEKLIIEIHQILEQKYGTMAINMGKIHSFLGMTFDFSQSGKVSIKMDKFVDEILDRAGVAGKAIESPAGEHLFKVRELELLPIDKQDEMHSIVAMLLYLAKRARPDLLTTVNFLCRRVKKFDADDEKKLTRMLNYLHSTKELCLTLCFEDGWQIVASVDSAYAVTHDWKSVSGAAISLGGGIVHGYSKAQKLITKSSTEAETVAASDYAGQAIWTRNFLIEQGYTSVGPVIIEQDNQSAMALFKKGFSTSERTRHISIRYFWLTDRVRSGELSIQYVPTDVMLADLLTKPLQGERFRLLRDRLLGITNEKSQCFLIF
jgi:hypothetical protein